MSGYTFSKYFFTAALSFASGRLPPALSIALKRSTRFTFSCTVNISILSSCVKLCSLFEMNCVLLSSSERTTAPSLRLLISSNNPGIAVTATSLLYSIYFLGFLEVQDTLSEGLKKMPYYGQIRSLFIVATESHRVYREPQR